MKTKDIYTTERKSLQQTEVPPKYSRLIKDGTLFIDFGKAAFGTLIIPTKNFNEDKLVIHLGEQLNSNGRLERNPQGSIRYIRIEQLINADNSITRIVIPPNERNTGPAAIKMPPNIGEVFPFRYAEIENAQNIDASKIKQIFVHYPFNDEASAFHSSNEILNAVWDICKYTIKATTFCGVYIDGDRERIPYEGDAYINQLGHYCLDNEYTLARYTHEYLIQHPTWPTEWILHSVMMAWADYMYTGETVSLETFYDDLKAKTLIGLARKDGLISTESDLCTRELEEQVHLYHDKYIFDHGLKDLVDWPPGSFVESGTGERDNHEMKPVNTVVNAMHCNALYIMSRIAEILGNNKDYKMFFKQAELVKNTINNLLFDQNKGIYIDGEGSPHSSLHSNMMMLAFDLVPQARIESVSAFIKSKGMACSVYGAQYLLEGLYKAREAQYALELLISQSDRSWWNMIKTGSTMTLEAWDIKYKNNLDWNHAWGAAPANIIPRFILGVQPIEPGFKKILIQPQPADLKEIRAKVPTIKGSINISFETNSDKSRTWKISIPKNTSAVIKLPAHKKQIDTVMLNGCEYKNFYIENRYICLNNTQPGNYSILIR